MRKLFTLILGIFILSSCSKTTYSIKQAWGQLALEMKSRSNKSLLEDKTVPDEHKHKIKLIENYKKFFYEYFQMKETPIYDETTVLDSEAVSYLVIASPVDKVEPVHHSFPLVGTFPYLGFFDKQDALIFRKELETEYFTYMRPVYAYSTLNQLFFYDNILSSFFQYDDYSLAQLIFHELTHTVFFVKGDVNFNESLAQYIGEELAQEYFNYKEEEKEQLRQKTSKMQKLKKILSDFVKEYNEGLQRIKPKTKKDALSWMRELYITKYLGIYSQQCQSMGLEDCRWDINKWNNARMAEFLTYQSKQSLVQQLRQKRKMSLKELLNFLIAKHDQFDSDKFEDFTSFLKHEEKL